MFDVLLRTIYYQINLAWVNIIAWSVSNFGTKTMSKLHKDLFIKNRSRTAVILLLFYFDFLCISLYLCFLPQWNEEKLTSLSLPSFNPFVIVFYFLFRRLAKREAPKINDYYYEDVYGEPGRVAPVAKTNDDNYGPTL